NAGFRDRAASALAQSSCYRGKQRDGRRPLPSSPDGTLMAKLHPAASVPGLTSLGSLVTAQLTITSGGTTIANARTSRSRIVCVNVGTVDIFIGTTGVTTGTGVKVAPGASLTLYTTAAVVGIVASTSGTLHTDEEYNA